MNTLAVDLDRECVSCSALTSSMVNGTPLCADCDTAENRIVVDIFTEGVAPTMNTNETYNGTRKLDSIDNAARIWRSRNNVWSLWVRGGVWILLCDPATNQRMYHTQTVHTTESGNVHYDQPFRVPAYVKDAVRANIIPVTH